MCHKVSAYTHKYYLTYVGKNSTAFCTRVSQNVKGTTALEVEIVDIISSKSGSNVESTDKKFIHKFHAPPSHRPPNQASISLYQL